MEFQETFDPQILLCGKCFSNLLLILAGIALRLDTMEKTKMANCEMFCFFNFYFICTADKISFLQLSLLRQQQHNILNSNILDLEEF